MVRLWTPARPDGLPVTWHCQECEVEWSGSRGCWFCSQPGTEGHLPSERTHVKVADCAQHAHGDG